ncbi:hypothetical protein VTK26DRAFT_9225 [Humicola hyalothermophila]
MPSTPKRIHGQATGYSSPREKAPGLVARHASSTHHRDQAHEAPQLLGRRSVSGTLATFFSRLRPSARPERGFAFRDPRDSAGESQPLRRATAGPTGYSDGERRSRSLHKHGSDTIPADRWNTPRTLPRWARSTGHGKLPDGPPQRSPSKRSATAHFPSIDNRLHNAPALAPASPRPQASAKPSNASSPPLNPEPSTAAPPHHSGDPGHSSARSRDLFLAKCELRRQRRSLKESGDFLGVTGVNPYTGELDVITPPTSSSEDAAVITTTTTTSTTTGINNNNSWPTGEQEMHRQARLAARLAKEARRMQREEARQSRAEERKEAVREVVQQQQIKWRREEGGWSSVAEPKLSPIPGSQQGSLKTAAPSSSSPPLSSDAGTVHRTPTARTTRPGPEKERIMSFLGRAGAARVTARARARRHLRRLRRRRERGEQSRTGVMSVVDRGRGQQEVEGEGEPENTASLCAPRTTAIRLRIPTPSHLRRLGPCLRTANPVPECPRI